MHKVKNFDTKVRYIVPLIGIVLLSGLASMEWSITVGLWVLGLLLIFYGVVVLMNKTWNMIDVWWRKEQEAESLKSKPSFRDINKL